MDLTPEQLLQQILADVAPRRSRPMPLVEAVGSTLAETQGRNGASFQPGTLVTAVVVEQLARQGLHAFMCLGGRRLGIKSDSIVRAH